MLLKYLSAATLATAAIAAPAHAEYPEKPVEFVVPWPPGDLEDVLTRMIADDFAKEYGVAAAVINKPGGGGGPFPGAISVATSPADGYVVGSFPPSVPLVGHQIGIDELTPERFDPLGIFLTYPFVLASSKEAPFNDIYELTEYAKSNEVSLAHFGAPLPPTKVSLGYAKLSGFEWGSEAAFDNLDCNTLAAGDADVINTTLQLVLPCLNDINILTTVTTDRTPLVPDSPTMGELHPELNLALWNGLFVVKDTPTEVREKIISVAKKTMASDAAQDLAKRTGAQVYWQDSAPSAERITSDRETLDAINSLLE
jgi:tripartite-type tricarboxylate transporter receptor subunit TctC